MAKFRFSLESVQKYKDQQLDQAKSEYAEAKNAVAAQKALIEKMRLEYADKRQHLNEKKAQGLKIRELNEHQRYLLLYQEKIEDEEIRLGQLERKARACEKKMVDAKVESKSIETLHDRRLDEFNAAEKKSEENFIEEFITNKMFH
ncbi:MAG: flagellar export protein FliJ [Clostridia bacterium]|nr:flagellar export protein FliJ [Clostridia bacterium]